MNITTLQQCIEERAKAKLQAKIREDFEAAKTWTGPNFELMEINLGNGKSHRVYAATILDKIMEKTAEWHLDQWVRREIDEVLSAVDSIQGPPNGH